MLGHIRAIPVSACSLLTFTASCIFPRSQAQEIRVLGPYLTSVIQS